MMKVPNVVLRSLSLSACAASERRSYRKQLQENCGCISSEGDAWAWKTENMYLYGRMKCAFQKSGGEEAGGMKPWHDVAACCDWYYNGCGAARR